VIDGYVENPKVRIVFSHQRAGVGILAPLVWPNYEEPLRGGPLPARHAYCPRRPCHHLLSICRTLKPRIDYVVRPNLERVRH